MANPRGALRQDVLHRMLDVAQHLSASANVTEILAVIVNAMRDTLNAQRATVFEYDAASKELFSTVAHGLGRSGSASAAPPGIDASAQAVDEIRIPTTAGLAGQCARNCRIINVSDAYADDRFNPQVDKQTGFHTESILTVPLVAHDGELIGVAQVLNKRGGPFDAQDEQIATALASHAAVAIKRGRLIEDQLVRQKLERDLQLARGIQQSTFPTRLPTLPGFSIDAWSEPAEETGGDAYDVIECQPLTVDTTLSSSSGDAKRVILLLADATGHGIGPALSVTQLRAMLRMAVRVGADLSRIVHHINHQLCNDLPPGRFITAWLGELNASDRTLKSLSAGQAPLLHYEATHDTVHLLGADAPPFGVMSDFELRAAKPIVMHPGDIFAVISDGVFEAADSSGRQFGSGRVVEVVQTHRREASPQIIAALKDAVATFTATHPAADDRTAIIIKCTEP